MKNKINISKLIKEKFKDNTLEIQDLFEEIDLALDESDQSSYHSKVVRNGVSDSIPENQESENISYRINGPATTRNPKALEPGYNGRAPGNIIPDKIAEAGEDTVPKGHQISRSVKDILVPVPDFYSLMTNPKLMQTGTNERELINKIMENIGAGDKWQDRISKLKNYTKFITDPDAGITKKDITQAISSLMMLNVLKKLSYFTDHPGKQFEYVFAPFISPTAIVAGDEATEIQDIKGVKGTSYGLKFLESGQLHLRGSIKNLKAKINEGETKFISYIICHPVGNGVIQIGTAGITILPDKTRELADAFRAFLNTNYNLVQGTYSKNWLLYERKSDSLSDMPKIMFLISSKESQPIETGKTKLQLTKDQYELGGAKKISQDFLSGKGSQSKMDLYAKQLEINKNDLVKLDKLLRQEFPEYRQKYPQVPDKEKKEEIVDYANSIINRIRQIKVELLNQLSVEAGESPLREETKLGNQNFLSEEPRIQKTQEPENSQDTQEGQFNIPINRFFKTYIVEQVLNLGSPETYNQQQLTFSNDLAKMYQVVLVNLNELNTNITKYFSTEQGSNQNAAKAAINNAEAIKTNVENISSK